MTEATEETKIPETTWKPLGEQRYRKLFVIAVEGLKTETQYLAIFNDQQSVIRVNCLKGNLDSSPPQVLKESCRLQARSSSSPI